MQSFNISKLLNFRSVENVLNWWGLRIGDTVSAILNKGSKKDKTWAVNNNMTK